MKKTIKILFLLLTMIVVFALSGCTEKDRGLETPTGLQLSDIDILSWDKVEGAASYLVEINDLEFETQTNELDIFTITNRPASYSITVTAVGDAAGKMISSPSEPLEYILEANPAEDFLFNKTKDGNGWEIKLNPDAKVKGKVVVPSKVMGKPVQKIANEGFAGNDEITGVLLPDSITEMGGNAFCNCHNLKRVRLPDVETLVTTFKNCTSLSSVQLPEVLRTISGSTFLHCESLKKIYIPAGVELIDSTAFDGCVSLESIEVAKENTRYRSEGNCLIEKERNDGEGDRLIRACKTSVIPASVKIICKNAYGYGIGLKKITIPGSVKVIAANAFTYNGEVEEVVIEEGVQYLGFESTGARDTIPEAFYNCKNLRSVSLPSTIRFFHVDGNPATPFVDCPALESVTVAEQNPYYRVDGNCLIDKTDLSVINGWINAEIPSYIKKIGDNAFSGSSITKLNLPEGLEEIGKNAFANCKNLKGEQVVIPESVKKIDYGAFMGDYWLCVLMLNPECECDVSNETFQYSTVYIGSQKATGYTDNAINFCGFGEDGGVPYLASITCNFAIDPGTAERLVLAHKMKSVFRLEGPWITVPTREGYTFAGFSREENSDTAEFGVITWDPASFAWDQFDAGGFEFVPKAVSQSEPIKVVDLTIMGKWDNEAPSKEKHAIPREEIQNLPDGTVLYAVWVKNDK